MSRKLKVYLAAQYSWRNLLRGYAKKLRDSSFEVTASWLKEQEDLQIELNDLTDEFNMQCATVDMRDIIDSDILIFFSVDPTTKTKRGGRHVEFGVGLAMNKTLLVVGPKENIFHHLPQVINFETFDECLTWLSDYGHVLTSMRNE